MRLDLLELELELRRLLGLLMLIPVAGDEVATEAIVLIEAANGLIPKLLKNCWFLIRDMLNV